jgi:hypothetical protein
VRDASLEQKRQRVISDPATDTGQAQERPCAIASLTARVLHQSRCSILRSRVPRDTRKPDETPSGEDGIRGSGDTQFPDLLVADPQHPRFCRSALEQSL